MTKIEVVPIHKTRTGGSMADWAREYITDREKAKQAITEAETDLAELEALNKAPKRRNIFRRYRQRRALESWLRDKGYKNADEAHSETVRQKTAAGRRNADAQHGIETTLPAVRQMFDGYGPATKDRADALFRTYNAPAEVVSACDEQAAQYGHRANLVEWLSHTPTEEAPFGATNEQLEAMLLWNADCTERLAADPSVAERLVNDHLAAIKEKVAAGELDASWADAVPQISQVIIGDIMDVRFLGYGDNSRLGRYNPEEGTLTLWPYEQEGDNDLSHVVGHETGHGLGGFKEAWLNEANNEMFTCIIEGRDPYHGTDIYEMNRAGLRAMLQGGNMTPKDLSAFFIGHDYEGNEARLREAVKEAYDGNDVLGAINAAYRESFDGNTLALHDPVKRDEAFFVAAQTATLIAKLFKDAQHDAASIADYLAEKATKVDPLKYIAYRQAVFFFDDMAHTQHDRS